MDDGSVLASEQPPGAETGVPRVARKRALLTVVLALAGTGGLVGALWAWIAPPIHAVVAISRKGERVHDYLGGLEGEPRNFFVGPVLLVSLLGVVAVVAAVAAWQWRDHRGPEMVVALSIGLIGAAAAAAGVGALLVRMRYGALDFDTVALSTGDHSLTYVRQAPPVFFGHQPLQVAATLLSPTGTASLIYALLATGTRRDDLSAYPPVNYPVTVPPTPTAPVAIKADGGGSSCP